jgi:hypothetical protein
MDRIGPSQFRRLLSFVDPNERRSPDTIIWSRSSMCMHYCTMQNDGNNYDDVCKQVKMYLGTGRNTDDTPCSYGT